VKVTDWVLEEDTVRVPEAGVGWDWHPEPQETAPTL
jgi:hypothetical protein